MMAILQRNYIVAYNVVCLYSLLVVSNEARQSTPLIFLLTA
jgi:hypothetical protein